MAKAVEITFAIGAALAGSFAGTFGKAGKALADFQKQAEQMQKQSAQIESFQKMQQAIYKNSAEMYTARDEAEALNAQAAVSKTRTQELSSQYKTAQQEVSRLNSENVRNTDAYKAAKLNMESLASQIKASSQPTAELQRQYKAAQEEVRRLEGAMKHSSAALKTAQQNAQGLNKQMKESQRETKSLSDKSKELTTSADKLQQTIDRDKESLSRMRTELKAAGIDTEHLATKQAQLTQQSQRMAEAQARYQRSKAALDQIKQNLSWNNMKGELMTAAGLGYTLYKPVSQAANFESAMARVNAVAFSGAGRDKEADAKSFKALSEQARQLGRDTQFTAVQAAQSQENLARAGFKADEIISAMPGLLNMAAAEGMDLAMASDIAASTLRGFNMSADQANRVADVLAQTSAASNTNIVGLGEGMKYVAPVAAKLGVSLEETSAMLGVMANAGIKGTEGGTALRGAFLRLAQEPKAVEKALNSLGVASRDAQGNMRKLPDIMTELAEKTKDMGDADRMQKLADIFGVRAVSGMMAVMSGVADGSLETLTQYNKEATGILKAMSEATGASLDDMRTAMKGVEPYTERLGISYRDLSIYTAMLAKSGATGAMGNQLLTATFSTLATNSKQVQKGLKAYGISLTNDDGKMRDFLEIMNDLNKAMGGMDGEKQLEALRKILGNDEAAIGLQSLMNQFENGAYFELDKVKTKGVSEEMAEKLLETYSGQMTLLGSATEGLMIDIGDVLLPMSKEIVRTITAWTSGLSKLAQEHPEITKAIVGTVGALAALKVGFVGLKIGWNLLKLPFQSLKVAIDFVNLKMLAHGKKAGLLSKVWGGLKSGAKGIGNAFKFVGKGIWGVFKGIGKGVFDVGKLALLKAKTVAVAIATKAWAASVWLWNVAMKAGSKLLDVGKLVLYYGKQILIATATKAWTAAQWLWNAAMSANPIGAIIAAIAAAIAIGYLMYKNWDKIKAWWNSWTVKDVFAVIKEYVSRAVKFAFELWLEFWKWLGSLALENIFEPIMGYVQEVCASAKVKWNELCAWWNSIRLGDIFAGVKNLAVSAYDYVKGKWQELSAWWDALSLSDMFALVKEYALGAWNFAKGKWEEFKAWWDSFNLGDIFPEGFSLSWDGVITGWENAKSVIKSGWAEVSKVFTLENIGDFGAALVSNFKGNIERLKNIALSAFETVRGVISSVDFSGIWGSLASGFTTVCDSIKGAWNGVTGFIKDTWNTAADYVSGAWNWTAGLFGYGEDTPEAQQKQLQVQVQDITALNKMSEGFSQRVAEMTQAWQPFKDSLGEGFQQIYTAMQGVADKIRGVVIPAVNELVSALSRVATEISAIVQAGNIEVDVRTPNQAIGNNIPQQYQRMLGGRRRAEGGFITQPEIALIGEAGREVVIPLEKQARGSELWIKAGRELGMLNQSVNITPHATGGIFTQPHIGLVAEAGSEAIIPLEDKSRGIPLWMAAGEELGFSFGGSSSNSNMSFTFNPTVSVTVNGGDPDSESKFRRILSEMFEDLFIDFQERMQRVAFE